MSLEKTLKVAATTIGIISIASYYLIDQSFESENLHKMYQHANNIPFKATASLFLGGIFGGFIATYYNHFTNNHQNEV